MRHHPASRRASDVRHPVRHSLPGHNVRRKQYLRMPKQRAIDQVLPRQSGIVAKTSAGRSSKSGALSRVSQLDSRCHQQIHQKRNRNGNGPHAATAQRYKINYQEIQKRTPKAGRGKRQSSSRRFLGHSLSRATQCKNKTGIYDCPACRRMDCKQSDRRISKGVQPWKQIHLCILHLRCQLHQRSSSQIETPLGTPPGISKGIQVMRGKRL